jgi:hypothetical protein
MGIRKKVADAVDKVETKLAAKLFPYNKEDLANEIEQASKDDKRDEDGEGK